MYTRFGLKQLLFKTKLASFYYNLYRAFYFLMQLPKFVVLLKKTFFETSNLV